MLYGCLLYACYLADALNTLHKACTTYSAAQGYSLNNDTVLAGNICASCCFAQGRKNTLIFPSVWIVVDVILWWIKMFTGLGKLPSHFNPDLKISPEFPLGFSFHLQPKFRMDSLHYHPRGFSAESAKFRPLEIVLIITDLCTVICNYVNTAVWSFWKKI
mgnify:CR=1 FL=1